MDQLSTFPDLNQFYQRLRVYLQLATGQLSRFADVGWVPHISRATAGTAGLTQFFLTWSYPPICYYPEIIVTEFPKMGLEGRGGLLKLSTSMLSISILSFIQSETQGQPRFKRKINRIHLLMGDATRSITLQREWIQREIENQNNFCDQSAILTWLRFLVQG